MICSSDLCGLFTQSHHHHLLYKDMMPLNEPVDETYCPDKLVISCLPRVNRDVISEETPKSQTSFSHNTDSDPQLFMSHK